MLQIRLSRMTDYLRPVVRALFHEEPTPTDPAQEAEAMLDKCRRMWPRLQQFVKRACVFTACNAFARVRTHYPTVEPQRFVEGHAAGTTREQLTALVGESKPAAEAVVSKIKLFREPGEGSGQ